MRDFDPKETFAGKTVPVAFLSTLTLESSPGGSERAQMISLTTLMQPPNHVVTSTLRIEVLLVAPDPADVRALSRIFLHSNWRLLTCGSEAEVTAMILSHPI